MTQPANARPSQLLHMESNVAASPSLNKNASRINTGHKMNRIRVGNNTNDSFLIATGKADSQKNIILRKMHQLIEKHFTCVEIKVDNETVSANINSIAKRLHLSKKEVRLAAKEDRLGNLMFNQIKSTSAVLSGYEKIINELDETKTPYSKTELMKTITQGVQKLNGINNMGSLSVITNEREFLIYRSPQEVQSGNLNVAERIKEVGKGSFGAVSTLKVLGSPGEKLVIKEAYYEGNHINKIMQTEIKYLRLVNQNGRSWGLPAPVRTVSAVISQKILSEEVTPQENYKTNVNGFITEQIDMDYEQKYVSQVNHDTGLPILPTNEELIFETDQLLSALTTLHDLNVLHRDIKDGNIFCVGDEVRLSDMGGLLEPKELLENSTRSVITTTFNSHGDVVAMDLLCKDPNVNQNLDQLSALGKKQDVFGMGVALFHRCHNNAEAEPYNIASVGLSGYEYQDTGWDPAKPNQFHSPRALPDHIDPALSSLILRMLSASPDERPTASEALAELRALTAANYPQVKEKISARIAANYPGSSQH